MNLLVDKEGTDLSKMGVFWLLVKGARQYAKERKAIAPREYLGGYIVGYLQGFEDCLNGVKL